MWLLEAGTKPLIFSAGLVSLPFPYARDSDRLRAIYDILISRTILFSNPSHITAWTGFVNFCPFNFDPRDGAGER